MPSSTAQFEGNPKERSVLGNDLFLDKLAIPVLRRHPNTTLDNIANDVCNELGITLAQVQSQSQDRLFCSARAMIATRAIEARVATLSDAARFLNRSASALSRAIARYRNDGR